MTLLRLVAESCSKAVSGAQLVPGLGMTLALAGCGRAASCCRADAAVVAVVAAVAGPRHLDLVPGSRATAASGRILAIKLYVGPDGSCIISHMIVGE
jgi:hypothetical protein